MRDILQRIKPRKTQAPQEQFVTYVRTRQWHRSRLKGIEAEHEPVPIKADYIEQRFFPFPQYRRKQEIENLIHQGEISVSKQATRKGREMHLYAALKPGAVNLDLLERRYNDDDLDDLHKAMRNHLMNASLPEEAPRTDYFNDFLQFRNQRPDLYFNVDDFAKRVHTPVTNFHREHRPNILLYGEETSSLDVQTMQPLLLGKILRERIGLNEFSQWIDDGHDIYIMLQNKAGLKTRDEGKKRFFEILFSPKNEELSQLFGHATWIEWINEYKAQEEPQNPNSKKKPHSNMAWLLQSTEVKVMRKVWESLQHQGIPFLSVHDEIIIRQRDEERALEICNGIFKNEFAFFKVNAKARQIEAPPKDPFDNLETYLNGLRFENGILLNEYKYPALWDTTPDYKYIDEETKILVQMMVINPSLLEFHQRFHIAKNP